MKASVNSLSFVFVVIAFCLFSCGNTDDRLATSTSPKRAVYFDFFNDIRLEIAELEKGEERLINFTSETLNFLENREAQEKYKIAGLYFEKGLNREQGAYDYADRFFPDGCVIHLIIYPPEQQSIWQSLQGYNKGMGKQVGQNYVFYQVFTANPVDDALEETITGIIDNNITKHAAEIGRLME